ncbi:DUF6922 domain-containing protein [Albibacterium sp.]|uniref:DUF6922 domain-containing protein n=1 Tax=Albibacterium sp. TaxID=2952885 RepID=UPI00169672B2|nr:hypothetical protein [Albibacterium sp.]NLX73736.1 hypothetical protein [Bacteroidales bacterium]HUH17986.1 hypothetical protein [Albibacterium sp.]
MMKNMESFIGNNQKVLSKFSSHLFWDVNRNSLDINRSRRLIVHRVLDYGLLKDWQLLVKVYGIKDISEISSTIKDLDIKSAAFVSLLSKTPLEQFSCFTTRRSIPQHSIF